MSQGQYAPKKKSSPCCIGCIVIGGLLLVLGVAIGFYAYKFAKENFSLVEVTHVADPAPETKADVLLPVKVGDFSRRTLNDNFNHATVFSNANTTGVAFAEYVDSHENYITVIALPTEAAIQAQKQGANKSGFSGRFSNNDKQYGFSIKDSFTSGGSTSLSWGKANWTFLVQTTSSLEQQFVKDFVPGTGEGASGEPPVSESSSKAAE